MNLKIIDGTRPANNLFDVKYILAVAAGKGGVGKSSLTANLALALKKLGHKVGILDADIYGPSIRKMLPEEVLPSQNPLNSDRIVPAISFGMSVISMSYFRGEGEASIVRAPIANALVQQFLQKVEWGRLDYLLIDFPPGTGDIQLTLMQQGALSGAVIVTTPQEIALMDVRKAMQMFVQMGVPIVGVVENMSYFQDPLSGNRSYPFGSGGGERLAREEGFPFLGQIPLDPELSWCGDNGASIYEKAPSSQGAEALMKITEQVVGHLNAIEELDKEYLKSFELIWNEVPDA